MRFVQWDGLAPVDHDTHQLGTGGVLPPPLQVKAHRLGGGRGWRGAGLAGAGLAGAGCSLDRRDKVNVRMETQAPGFPALGIYG